MLHWTKDALFVVAAFIAAGIFLPIGQFATPLLLLAALLGIAVCALDRALEHLGCRSWKAMIAETFFTILIVGSALAGGAFIGWVPRL